jgi:hypothetical protein
MLAAEYCRQQNLGVCYASEVFIDRDGDYPQDAIKAEPKAVKVAEGFQRWVSKPGFVRPDAFGSITPSRDSLHEVIVLASAEY